MVEGCQGTLPFAAGLQLKVTGLIARHDLNGCLAAVLGPEMEGRLPVRIIKSNAPFEDVRLRPCHLLLYHNHLRICESWQGVNATSWPLPPKLFSAYIVKVAAKCHKESIITRDVVTVAEDLLIDLFHKLATATKEAHDDTEAAEWGTSSLARCPAAGYRMAESIKLISRRAVAAER